ncbi:hypothetical protein Hanom_Chr09g00863911 [Helianthus anomalus]
MFWDLIRHPSSDACSRASLSVSSCNLLRTDPSFFLFFTKKEQWEMMGFQSEICIKIETLRCFGLTDD